MSELTPQQQWDALKAEILVRINGIDAATQWQEVEPDWWLKMMRIARAVRTHP